MMVPDVSIIMACYNAADVVGRAIDSVIDQTYTNWELICVDDASSDRTPALLHERAANESRLRVITCERNGGPGAARNLGISSARGEWITVLDSDDWYEPKRVEVLLAAAEKHQAQLVADNQSFVRQGEQTAHRLLLPRSNEPFKQLAVRDLLEGDHWTQAANLGLLKPMVKRGLLDQFDIRYDEEVGIGEDFYFLLKCTHYAAQLLLVGAPLYNYQVRANSFSRSLNIEQIAAIRTMHDRCSRRLGGDLDEHTAQLMKKRRRDLDMSIRYRKLIIPIKGRDYVTSLKQALADPIAVWLAARMFVRRLGRRRRDRRSEFSAPPTT